MSQARFQKMQREKARQEKAAAKAARREARQIESENADEAAPPDDADQAAVLAELAALHERFEAGDVTFDDFTEAKEALTERLHIS